MSIQKLSIQLIVEDIAGPSGTLGESGFSALVKVLFTDLTKLKILFDTGPSHVALSNNIRKLQVDLKTLDAIVLSHGHWDHVGGLKEVLSLTGKRIPIICHPQAISPKIIIDKGRTIDLGIQGYFESKEDLETQAKLITTTNPYKLADSIMTTGEIPRINDYETLIGRLTDVSTTKNGKSIPDTLEDDLSLFFHLADDNIVILTGCCHAGIVNTTDLVSELTSSNNITGIVGGLHLHNASYDRLKKTVYELEKYPIQKIAPCHCSGFRGKAAISTAFGNKFIESKVFTKLDFVASSK